MSIIILWLLYHVDAPFYMYFVWSLCFAINVFIDYYKRNKKNIDITF